jgi:hypothetical protein
VRLRLLVNSVNELNDHVQVTGYRLQVTGYRLQVTGYRLHVQVRPHTIVIYGVV